MGVVQGAIVPAGNYPGDNCPGGDYLEVKYPGVIGLNPKVHQNKVYNWITQPNYLHYRTTSGCCRTSLLPLLHQVLIRMHTETEITAWIVNSKLVLTQLFSEYSWFNFE